MLLYTATVVFLTIWFSSPLFAQAPGMKEVPNSPGQQLTEASTATATAEPQIAEVKENDRTKSVRQDSTQLGGPKSVGAQLKTDDKREKPFFAMESFERALKPYDDFKAWVNDKMGLQFGGDYNVLLQDASRSPGEGTAAGGVFRFFGQWDLVNRDAKNTGTLVYKVENRHRLGTDMAPQQLAGEIGYAGLTAQTFSNAGWSLTNFYWRQELLDGKLGFVLGQLDVTDYVDVYGLLNPWTDFSNLVFGNGPTIPAPGQGLGAAAAFIFPKNIYVLAGLADANGDPTDPWEGVNTFLGDREFFKHVELGWFSSYESRYENNIHLTGWQADERKDPGVPNGWGVAFSFNHLIADVWLPFVRLGYSDGGGGTILDRSITMGFGRYMRQKSDMVGVGLNWGRPSEETFGPDLRNQYTAELYYRLHLLPHLTITPDVQFVVNPALNPTDDQIWVFGLRARLDF